MIHVDEVATAENLSNVEADTRIKGAIFKAFSTSCLTLNAMSVYDTPVKISQDRKTGLTWILRICLSR